MFYLLQDVCIQQRMYVYTYMYRYLNAHIHEHSCVFISECHTVVLHARCNVRMYVCTYVIMYVGKYIRFFVCFLHMSRSLYM